MVADRLIREIACSHVGGRLPGERDLSMRYAASRDTVRQAIIELEVRGLVEVRPGAGMYVRRTLTAGERLAASGNLIELLQARALFEGEVAALAATRVTDAQIGELEVYLDSTATARVRRCFHLIVAEMTKNAVIIGTIRDLCALCSEAMEGRSGVSSDMFTKSCQQSTVGPIIESLQRRDSNAARVAMKACFYEMQTRLTETPTIPANKRGHDYGLLPAIRR